MTVAELATHLLAQPAWSGATDMLCFECESTGSKGMHWRSNFGSFKANQTGSRPQEADLHNFGSPLSHRTSPQELTQFMTLIILFTRKSAEMSPLDTKKKLLALKKKWGTNKGDNFVRIVWMRAGDSYVRSSWTLPPYCF